MSTMPPNKFVGDENEAEALGDYMEAQASQTTAISDAARRALSDAEDELGRPLTDAERDGVLDTVLGADDELPPDLTEEKPEDDETVEEPEGEEEPDEEVGNRMSGDGSTLNAAPKSAKPPTPKQKLSQKKAAKASADKRRKSKTEPVPRARVAGTKKPPTAKPADANKVAKLEAALKKAKAEINALKKQLKDKAGSGALPKKVKESVKSKVTKPKTPANSKKVASGIAKVEAAIQKHRNPSVGIKEVEAHAKKVTADLRENHSDAEILQIAKGHGINAGNSVAKALTRIEWDIAATARLIESQRI